MKAYEIHDYIPGHRKYFNPNILKCCGNTTDTTSKIQTKPLAINSHNQNVEPDEPNAIKFSMLGAIEKAYTPTNIYTTQKHILLSNIINSIPLNYQTEYSDIIISPFYAINYAIELWESNPNISKHNVLHILKYSELQ